MTTIEKTAELIIAHYNKYPLLEIVDLFKYLFQSSFGCEHLVSSLQAVTDYIIKEYKDMQKDTNMQIEPLDGDYSRVGLGYIGLGVDTKTFGELFFRSAKKEAEGLVRLEEKIGVLKVLITTGHLPFSISEFESQLGEWQSLGYPAVRHSETFRNNYHPAYRVIANEYLPVIESAVNTHN